MTFSIKPVFLAHVLLGRPGQLWSPHLSFEPGHRLDPCLLQVSQFGTCRLPRPHSLLQKWQLLREGEQKQFTAPHIQLSKANPLSISNISEAGTCTPHRGWATEWTRSTIISPNLWSLSCFQFTPTSQCCCSEHFDYVSCHTSARVSLGYMPRSWAFSIWVANITWFSKQLYLCYAQWIVFGLLHWTTDTVEFCVYLTYSWII